MKRLFITYLLCLMTLGAFAAEDCLTIKLSADKTEVTIDDPSVTISGELIGGSGYYTWLKDGEEVDDGPMSLGEFVLYHQDDEVADSPCTVKYTLNITNSKCNVSEDIYITVKNAATSVKEVASADAIIVKGRHILQGGSSENLTILNLAGAEVQNPVPAAGVYIVKSGSLAQKVVVR